MLSVFVKSSSLLSSTCQSELMTPHQHSLEALLSALLLLFMPFALTHAPCMALFPSPIFDIFKAPHA